MLLDYPIPDRDSTHSEDWAPHFLRSPGEAIAQAITYRSVPRHLLALRYSSRGLSEVKALLAAIRSNFGPQSRLHFWTPTRDYTEASLGTGDGTTRVFPLPLYDWENVPDVTVAGAAKTHGNDWWFGVENFLNYSEDFSQTTVWVAPGGATVTRTSGRTDPIGGTTAWRIQTSGGTYQEKLVQIRTDIPTATSSTWGVSCWVKNNGTVTVRVGIRYSGNPGTYVDVPAGSGWTLCQAFGSPTSNYFLGIEFRALSAAHSLDFDVWHPVAAIYKWPGTIISSASEMADIGYVFTAANPVAIHATGRRYATFATAPANGAEVKASAIARRLLWGHITGVGRFSYPAPGRVGFELALEGEEATGDET